MKAHIIENEKIVNTIEVDSLDFLPNLIDASSGGAIGWGYVNGQLIEPEIVVEVPQTLTPRQIRMQLTASGLRQSVEDYISASTDYDLKDWWEYATSFDRNSAVLIDTAHTLGLTDEQIDTMFIEASKL